ncbi:MAG: hypothetical protein AB8B55_10785 [Mariniblastus sp.]
MYEQKEYMLAYALVFAFVILGMLVVCVPRPRKSEFVDPEQAAKDKRINQQKKAKAKMKKKSEKTKKKKMKARSKAKAKKK